jgi:hypothetical protein
MTLTITSAISLPFPRHLSDDEVDALAGEYFGRLDVFRCDANDLNIDDRSYFTVCHLIQEADTDWLEWLDRPEAAARADYFDITGQDDERDFALGIAAGYEVAS